MDGSMYVCMYVNVNRKKESDGEQRCDDMRVGVYLYL
jgi:hypothetical protein